LNENKTVNDEKQGKGEHEGIKEGKYNLALVNLMEKIVDVV
jgi:hypothetical protein